MSLPPVEGPPAPVSGPPTAISLSYSRLQARALALLYAHAVDHPLSLAALTDRLYASPAYPRPAQGDKAAAALLRGLQPKVAADGAKLERVSALGRGVPGYYRLSGDLRRVKAALIVLGYIVEGDVTV